MIEAVAPYIIKYDNPSCDRVNVFLSNVKIATYAQNGNYIEYAYYHPVTGIVQGVGVDDYVGVIDNSNLEIYSCINNQKRWISRYPLPKKFKNLSLSIDHVGKIKVELYRLTQSTMNITLFDVLQSLAVRIGYKVRPIGKIDKIAITGISFPSNTNVHHAIKVISEFLACELSYGPNRTINLISIVADTGQEPIYIEEKEHAFSIIYGEKEADLSGINIEKLKNAQLKYIPDININSLLDYRKTVTTSNDQAYLYDTSLVCDDNTAIKILQNAIKTKFFKIQARKTAIVTTTLDYLRVEKGDICFLNSAFYVAKNVSVDKGKVVLHLENRDISARYPVPPIYTKVQEQTIEPAPEPLKTFQVFDITGQISKDSAPFFVYCDPVMYDVMWEINGAVVRMPQVEAVKVIANLDSSSASIMPRIPILSNRRYTGFLVINHEILYVANDILIQRAMYNSTPTQIQYNDIGYLVESFIHTLEGRSIVEGIYINIYTIAKQEFHSVILSPPLQTYKTLFHPEGVIVDVIPYQIDL